MRLNAIFLGNEITVYILANSAMFALSLLATRILMYLRKHFSYLLQFSFAAHGSLDLMFLLFYLCKVLIFLPSLVFKTFILDIRSEVDLNTVLNIYYLLKKHF